MKSKIWSRLQNSSTQQNRPFEALCAPASSPTLSGMVSSAGDGQLSLSSQSTSKSSIFLGIGVLQPALLAVLFLVCSSLHGEIQCQLLITGCGRSGTFYITEVLRNCGLDLRHETLGEYGSASWLMAFDAESLPYQRDSRLGVHFSHVFHQVRHPLKVIASFRANTFHRSWPYIHTCIPEIHPEDPFLVKCAKYWYYWNLKVDQEAEWTYRIEDIEDVWDEFQERLNVKLDPNVFKKIPKNRNHLREPENITWEDLRLALDDTLFQNIRNLAQHYGYALSE